MAGVEVLLAVVEAGGGGDATAPVAVATLAGVFFGQRGPPLLALPSLARRRLSHSLPSTPTTTTAAAINHYRHRRRYRHHLIAATATITTRSLSRHGEGEEEEKGG
jgi:hypothetical protein